MEGFIQTKTKRVYVRATEAEALPADLPAFVADYFGADLLPIYLSGPHREETDPSREWYSVKGPHAPELTYVGREADGTSWEVI